PGAYPAAVTWTATNPGCTGLIVAVPSAAVCAVTSCIAARRTLASATGRPSGSTTVTMTLAPAITRITAGSLVSVSACRIGPPTCSPAVAVSVYVRPTSSSNANEPSSSVLAVRGGTEPSITVAPPTGSPWSSTTWPSSRSGPVGSTSSCQRGAIPGGAGSAWSGL